MPAPDATATVQTSAAAGQLVAGRYLLVRLIASGGMAEVWEATDQVLGRPVAVKMLHRHLASNEAFTQRFRAEAVAAARLHHPSIVAIFDTCSGGGHEAIVMELVRGRTLRTYLDERGRLDADEVTQIGADVSDALDAAHRAGIIHRDVKPANILLCDDARVMVADFGIAKVRDDTDLTNTGTMLGTVKYLAPEQVESAPVDARTDIYALGVVLYEALAGRPPFMGDTAAATALARLHQTPTPIDQLRPDIPPALAAAVMRALARHPDQRFESARDFRAALLARSAPVVAPANPLTDATTVSPGHAPGDRTTAYPRPAGPDPAHWPPPPPRPVPAASPRPAPQRWALPLVVTLVVIGSIALAIALVTRTDSTDPSTGGAAGAAAPLTLTAAEAFDPFGGDGEHDAEAARAIDGNPATSWRTETYAQRDFGGGKTGVGLAVTVDRARDLQSLVVSSPTRGWSAAVYVADEAPKSLEGWGDPVTSAAEIDGSVTFDLQGERGGAILLWITELGDRPRRVQVDELAVFA